MRLPRPIPEKGSMAEDVAVVEARAVPRRRPSLHPLRGGRAEDAAPTAIEEMLDWVAVRRPDAPVELVFPRSPGEPVIARVLIAEEEAALGFMEEAAVYALDLLERRGAYVCAVAEERVDGLE